jgi:hypothetical protein
VVAATVGTVVFDQSRYRIVAQQFARRRDCVGHGHDGSGDE